KPQLQGRRRLVKDRPGCRMHVIAARIAVVAGATVYAMEAALAITLGTMRCVAVRRVPLAPQPFQTRSVVRELAGELHDRVGRLGGRGADRTVPVYRRHEGIFS